MKMKIIGGVVLSCILGMTLQRASDDPIPVVENIESMEGSIYNTFAEETSGAVLNKEIPAELFGEMLTPLRNATREHKYPGGIEVGCIFIKISRFGYMRVILYEDVPTNKFAYFSVNGRIYSVQPAADSRPRRLLSKILGRSKAMTIKPDENGSIIQGNKK